MITDQILTFNLLNKFSKTPLLNCIYIIIKDMEGSDTMEELLGAVANTGFPIAVAAYLLIRIESKMDSLSSSINQLSTILSIKLGSNDGNKQS
jgi:hypothetical protein